jgi:hypothetical protein
MKEPVSEYHDTRLYGQENTMVDGNAGRIKPQGEK